MQEYSKDRPWPFARGSGPTIALATLTLVAFGVAWRMRSNRFTRSLLALVAGIWSLILYFFRDPDRSAPDEPGLVVSAGDGEVVAIVHEREEEYLKSKAIRISIFLSLFDVHVQRIPIDGVIRSIHRRPGKFLQAFRPEASSENEHIAMIIDSPYGPVLVKQIAGIMARRCLNYAMPADEVQTGQRFGLIRFGSRVDLFLPPAAEILATIGSTVRGGVTPLARLAKGE